MHEVYAREGSAEGFRQGLHGQLGLGFGRLSLRQLDRMAFEAEHGDFSLNMGCQTSGAYVDMI